MTTRRAATSARRARVRFLSAEMIPIGEGFLGRLAELVAWLGWGVEVVKQRWASPLGGSGGWVVADEAISDGGAESGGGRCHPR